MKIIESKKQLGLQCCVYKCKNKPDKRKGGLCHKHYRRKRNELDPVYIRYENFKHNALRRGKEFTITVEEFRNFCIKNNYIISKGRRGRRCTIDRLCNVHGYHIWNIGIKTLIANIKKYHNHDKSPF